MTQTLILNTRSSRLRWNRGPRRLLIGLTGYSDIIGRDVPAEWPTYANASRIFNFNQTTEVWEQATDPLHSGADAFYGVGPGMALADRLLNILPDPYIQIGLIPTGLGDTYSAGWASSADPTAPFGKFLYKTRKAILYPNSELIATIHWQGLNDATIGTSAAAFEANLLAYMAGCRKQFGKPNLPVILVKIPTPADAVSRPTLVDIQGVFDDFSVSPPDPNVVVISPPDPSFKDDNIHCDVATQIATGHVAGDALYPLLSL